MLVGLVLGCGGGLGAGGTGSSGFDEQFVISSVLDEGTCQDGEGTDYCPTNVDDPSGDGQTVDADVPDETPVDCTDPARALATGGAGEVRVDATVLGEACGFDVPVMPEGFEDGVTIRIAVRVTGGDDNWQISDVVYEGTDPEFTAEVEVDAPADVSPDGAFEVQVAILTFDPGAGDPPAEVETLSESGATTVYVTPEVTVVTDPEPTPGARPTATPPPTATPAPTDEPTPAPTTGTDGPSATPTPARTIVPATPTPARTVGATPSPGRTRVPPAPTRTVDPPRATDTPATPRPTAQPKPTDEPRPTEKPRPTDSPRPTASPDSRPAPTPGVRPTLRPVDLPRPTTTTDIEPTPTPRPVFTDPRPTAGDRTPPRIPND